MVVIGVARKRASSIIEQIDRFLTIEPDLASLDSMLMYGRRLLSSAESSYRAAKTDELRKVLEQRIYRLRERLSKLQKKSVKRPVGPLSLREKILQSSKLWLAQEPTVTLSAEDKLARTRVYLEKLKALATVPTAEEKSVISQLTSLYNRLKGEVPARYPTSEMIGAKEERFPPVYEKAKDFHRRMARMTLTKEKDLRKAIEEGKGHIDALRAYLDGLSLDERKRKETAFTGMMRAIGQLVRKWERQIDMIKVKESKMRIWGWQKEKSEYQVKSYVESKRKAEREGERVRTLHMLADNFTENVQKIVTLSKTLRQKAEKDKMPELLPISKFSKIVRDAENFVSGVKDKLSSTDRLAVIGSLNALKREQMSLKNLHDLLSGEKKREESERLEAIEVLDYFRKNLPSEIRNLLTPYELANFEKKAAVSVDAAKEAIKDAISLAAKKSPEKVRRAL